MDITEPGNEPKDVWLINYKSFSLCSGSEDQHWPEQKSGGAQINFRPQNKFRLQFFFRPPRLFCIWK